MDFMIWVFFIAFILVMIGLDIGVLHKKDKAISTAESLAWTGFCVVLALLFNVFIFYSYENHWFGLGLHIGQNIGGKKAALDFFTGYLIEESLSIDNLFVIALIFTYFKIPLKYQHRILFWGILGALVFRGMMIGLGALLVSQFSWINYVFGGLLIFTAVKMLIDRHETMDLEHYAVVKFIKKFYPVSTNHHTGHFFVIENGKKAMTTLFLALIVIETTDVFFAVDSIPAIFAITTDTFIVFTSNVFAILGLRSLYFSIAVLMERLTYLKTSLIFLLVFVGTKLIIAHHYPIPTWVSLSVIAGILAVGILASVIASRREAMTPIEKDIEYVAVKTGRQIKRVIVIITGSVVLLVGVALIVLPGPAILVIPLGLTILATELIWVKRFNEKMKVKIKKFTARYRKR